MLQTRGSALCHSNIERKCVKLQKTLLRIEDLHASVEEKEIIKGLHLETKEGEIHVLLGPNGAGKSILANVIMGHPGYSVTDGHLYFEEDDITEAKTNERGKKGLLLSNQAPEEIPGITMENFLKSTRTALTEEK